MYVLPADHSDRILAGGEELRHGVSVEPIALILEVTECVELATRILESLEQLDELRALEDEGDRIVRQAVAGLFRSGQDPISIIRWKDIHERLEEAVDALENAADVLEAIVVKNR